MKAVAEGYALACVDYRYVSDEGVVLLDLIKDVKAAIRYLRANAETYNFNPDKFALIGESAGGQLVDIVGTTNGETLYDDPSMGNADVSSDVQAVVSWYSVAELDSFLVGWLYNTDVEALTEEEMQAKINEASGIAHIDANDPPFLLQVGLIDSEVDYTQTINFYNDLYMAGVDVELDLFPGYEHAVSGFISEENAARIIEWLDEALDIT